MSPTQKLKEIDAALAAENLEIAEARERVKSLLDERTVVALEVTNAERQRERAKAVKRGQKWRDENPEEHVLFMDEFRQRNAEGVLEGARQGWWDLDDGGNMLAPAKVFKLSDFAEVKNAKLAHVMAKAEIFPSVGQARKNGWDKPLVTGEWTVTKKKIRIKVVT